MRAVGAENLEGHGIAGHMEPLATAILMAPALEVHTLGVFTHEQIGFHLVIGAVRGVAGDVRLAVGVEFGFFGGNAAAGAGYD